MISIAAIAVLLTVPSFAEPNAKQPHAEVEHVTGKPKPGNSLGTKSYSPSDSEAPFFKKLSRDEVATGGLASDYDIHDKQGKYVGWFGIVREIKEEKAHQQTVLTVEHKYFDGLTDAHIQAISFNGDGDFLAVVPGVGHKIESLSLVKVYGTVANNGKKDARPTLDAEFVRDWHWGSFTFLAAMGEQHGGENWRKLNKVELDDIYDPYPDEQYYEDRLGRRPKHDAR